MAANQSRGAWRGPASRLLAASRFVALAYLHALVWLSLWVLVPMLLLGWRPMAVTSGSMGPAVRAGDVVLIAPADGEGLRAGQLVTFDDPGEPGRVVTHRVVGRDADGYRTKGDANPTADSVPVPPEAIRGVGRLVVPRVALPLLWAEQRRLGPLSIWMLSVALALALLPARRRTTRPVVAPLPAAAPHPMARSWPAPAPRPAPVPRPGFAAAAVPPARLSLRLPPPPVLLALPTPPGWIASLVPPPP